MRKASTKERYSTLNLQKAGGPCRLYSGIQRAFAMKLEEDAHIKSFQVNVLLDRPMTTAPGEWMPGESFMSDFVIEYVDGRQSVRETVQRIELSRFSVLEKLDYSCQYWKTQGIEDWGLVVDKKEKENAD